MSWWSRGAAVALVCAAVTATGRAQQQEGEGAYRMQVRSHLIEMTLTVRDAQGKLVTGLPETAFHVTEDGAPQAVRYFAQQRERPLSVGLLVDESGSQEGFVHKHEDAVREFLKTVMEPRDRAFAVCFGNYLRVASDWTSDPEALLEGVRRFDKGERGFPEIGRLEPWDKRALGTALFDAVWSATREKMAAETGRRRVLIVLSDGEDNSSEHDLEDAMDAAQDGDVLVYSIRTTELEHGRMNARGRYGMRTLDHLGEATGARSFDLKAVKLKNAFQEIAEELKTTYEVGYYSTHAATRDRRWRKVVVEADGGTVQARTGYRPRE